VQLIIWKQEDDKVSRSLHLNKKRCKVEVSELVSESNVHFLSNLVVDEERIRSGHRQGSVLRVSFSAFCWLGDRKDVQPMPIGSLLEHVPELTEQYCLFWHRLTRVVREKGP